MLQKTQKYTTYLSLRSLRRTVFKVISEFTQQDGKTVVCDKRERDRARPFALVDHVINF